MGGLHASDPDSSLGVLVLAWGWGPRACPGPDLCPAASFLELGEELRSSSFPLPEGMITMKVKEVRQGRVED